MKTYHRSRKHVLDWVSHPDFVEHLNALLEPRGAVVGDRDQWAPRLDVSSLSPREAGLDSWGPRVLPGVVDWTQLRAQNPRAPLGPDPAQSLSPPKLPTDHPLAPVKAVSPPITRPVPGCPNALHALVAAIQIPILHDQFCTIAVES